MSLPPLRITGSGPVALAFALFVRRLLGPGAPVSFNAAVEPPALSPALSARPLAISHGSRLLLERVATFPAQAAPIRRIDIALSGLPGRVRLSADEIDLPALGWVVRHGQLTQALREALDRSAPARPPTSTAAGAPGKTVAPDSGAEAGTPSSADIRVIADGDPGEDARARSSDQAAVLAEVRASHGEPGLAVERFTPEGPLALLPLPSQPGQPPRWSLVWCAEPSRCAERAALPDEAFAAALQQAFGDAFGMLAPVTRPVALPLARRMRRETVRQRTVWIGNAAQALHPVAGQGLNLGLRDAYELADTLARAAQRDVPIETALARYASRRAADRESMTRVTDLLASGLRAPLVRPMQSAALVLLDGVPALREAIARGFIQGFARG